MRETASMKGIYATVLAVIILVPRPACAQKTAKNPPQPVETDICQTLSKPYAYNNKIVKVRGYLTLVFEYSLLVDESCAAALWLAFADGSAPRQLIATVNGSGTAGAKDASGRRIPPNTCSPCSRRKPGAARTLHESQCQSGGTV